MISRRTHRFRRQLAGLTPEIRRAAFESYRMFLRDPRHNSPKFKLVNVRKGVYSARVNRDFTLVDEEHQWWVMEKVGA